MWAGGALAECVKGSAPSMRVGYISKHLMEKVLATPKMSKEGGSIVLSRKPPLYGGQVLEF